MQTPIRLLLEEPSEQGLHCLQFPLHFLAKRKPPCSAFRVITANSRVSKFLGVLRYFQNPSENFAYLCIIPRNVTETTGDKNKIMSSIPRSLLKSTSSGEIQSSGYMSSVFTRRGRVNPMSEAKVNKSFQHRQLENPSPEIITEHKSYHEILTENFFEVFSLCINRCRADKSCWRKPNFCCYCVEVFPPKTAREAFTCKTVLSCIPDRNFREPNRC